MANSALIGVGYLIDSDLAEKLMNNEETEDFICQLNYHANDEISFFGEILTSSDPGEATFLSMNVPDFASIQVRVKEECGPYVPDELGMPQLYLLTPWD